MMLLLVASVCAAYVGPPRRLVPSPRAKVSPLRSVPTAVLATERPAALLPTHPDFVKGRLDNGLEYVILPCVSAASPLLFF